MTLLNKEPVKRVEKLLKEFSQNQKVISLDSSARTALEAASSLSCEVGAIVKSLLFKTEQNYTLCLVAGDKKASLNKIKKILNTVKIMTNNKPVLAVIRFAMMLLSFIGLESSILFNPRDRSDAMTSKFKAIKSNGTITVTKNTKSIRPNKRVIGLSNS